MKPAYLLLATIPLALTRSTQPPIDTKFCKHILALNDSTAKLTTEYDQLSKNSKSRLAEWAKGTDTLACPGDDDKQEDAAVCELKNKIEETVKDIESQQPEQFRKGAKMLYMACLGFLV